MLEIAKLAHKLEDENLQIIKALTKITTTLILMQPNDNSERSVSIRTSVSESIKSLDDILDARLRSRDNNG